MKYRLERKKPVRVEWRTHAQTRGGGSEEKDNKTRRVELPAAAAAGS